MLSRILPLATKLGAATLVLSATLAPAANAQILSQFTFGTVANGTSTGVGYSPTTVGTNVTASNLTIVGATNVSMAINVGTYSTAALLFNPNVSTDIATFASSPDLAVSGSRFFSFSVTPNTNFQTSLTSLDFMIGRGGGGSRGYVVRSSVDGFAANIATGGIATTTVRPAMESVSLPLTGSVFQNLTTATTFRVYSYSPSNGNTVDYDNVTLNGSVSAVTVPEASTMALLSFAGGIGAVVIARRRKK